MQPAATVLGITGPGDILIALLAGVFPALLWLWFWEQEDRRHPEPRRLVLRAFLAGMVAVPLVLPFQRYALDVLSDPAALIVAWAIIEEVMKLAVAAIIILRHPAVDEPLDPIMYLITIALGFSALENALFLLNPLASGNLLEGLTTGNLRFIGATLIHVLSSAVIGGALALSFFKPLGMKLVFGFCGVILAIFLHALFNILILETSADRLLHIFLGVWVGIILLLLFLERVKQMRAPSWSQIMFIRKKD
jgi:RsiW-degrading membrane proteinase PrsW (M82 family)